MSWWQYALGAIVAIPLSLILLYLTTYFGAAGYFNAKVGYYVTLRKRMNAEGDKDGA